MAVRRVALDDDPAPSFGEGDDYDLGGAESDWTAVLDEVEPVEPEDLDPFAEVPDLDHARDRDLEPAAQPIVLSRDFELLSPAQRERVSVPDWAELADTSLDLAAPAMQQPISRLDRDSEDADAWLRAHDPARTTDGVKSDVDAALSAAGVTPEDLDIAMPSHRPSKAGAATRARLCEALKPLYEDGARRDYMAEALGRSRQALDNLMA